MNNKHQINYFENEKSKWTHFPPDHDRSGRELHLGIASKAVVHCYDVEDVEQLPFVLMDSLDLHIEHRGRLHLHVELLLDQRRQLHLILLLSGDEILNFNSLNQKFNSEIENRFRNRNSILN